MGNSLPSSIVASLKGIVHLALIVSLSFSSFSLNQVSLVSNSAHAAPDGGGGDNSAEVPKEVRHLLARIANHSSFLTPQDISKIPSLEKYQIFDVGDILWDRVEHEIRMMNDDRHIGQSKVGLSDLLGVVFKIATAITTDQHKEHLKRCINILENQMKYLSSFVPTLTEDQVQEYKGLDVYLSDVLENFKRLSKSPSKKLPSLTNPIEIPGKSTIPVSKNGDVNMAIRQDSSVKVISRDQIEAMEDWMAKEIIGQPTALRVLSKWLYETYAYGYGRDKPRKLFISGMPGTGKDTIVRAAVNAMHQDPNAYKEHMFELPITKDKNDLWTLQGSATGHVDADKISALNQWLVKRSGGRYFIVKPEGNEKFNPYVDENKEWRPGMVLPGTNAAEESFLYVNEVDKWSKNNINQYLLRAIEQGYFPIGNPGPTGVDKLYVPVNIIFSSNDLIPYIASRDRHGRRIGPALEVEQMNEKVIQIEQDKSIFRQGLQSASSGADFVGSDATGYSEEFINRFKDEELLPLRVLGREDLKKILNLNMTPLSDKFKNSYGAYAGLELSWTENLIEFMYSFQKNPEEGARLMGNRVEQMVESTIMDMIKAQKIKPADLPLKVEVDVEKNQDGTSNLVLRRTDGSGQVYAHNLIAATEAEKKKSAISDAEFADLATLPKRLAKHVFGVDHILEKMGRTIALSKDAETRKVNGIQEEKKAEVFFLLGFSSTGKTETGKALARELFKNESARIVIDFNNVHSIHDLRTLILGHTIGDRVVPSKFMEEYDRVGGRAVFMFEEVANAPLEILKALYDILDEPVVTTFADKKARSMRKVIILATGNNGEKWYKGVPRDVSLEMQMTTMREIYKKMISDQDAMRVTLEEAFSEAFINRIGIDRFFFYPPFGYESIRKLSIGRVQKSLEDLKPKDGQRGWNIGFKNQADYESLLTTVEHEGFVLREQGRSIVNFVDAEITNKIRWELRSAAVPDKARVLVVPAEGTPTEAKFDLIVEGRPDKLSLNVKKRERAEEPKKPVQDIALTSFHEAGHNFLTIALLGDKFKPTRVTRIPGVLMRETEAVIYNGVAESEMVESYKYNREMVLERVAMVLGGDIAESLVTKNGRRHSGIQDDIARATELAQAAVGEWGLSDKWGRRYVKADEIKNLSESDRNLFNSEVDKFLRDARALGVAILSEPGNFEVFKALGLEIFVKGDLKEEAIAAFYKKHGDKINYPGNINAVIAAGHKIENAVIAAPESNGLFVKAVQRHHNVEFVEGITLPTEYASLESILADLKKEELSKVELPKNLPIFTDFKTTAPAKVASTTTTPAPQGPKKTETTKAAPMCNKPLFGK